MEKLTKEKSYTDKELNPHWAKIKKILFSTDKLIFLNKILAIELNLFLKDGANEESAIRYKDFNEKIKLKYNYLSEFNQMKIIRPMSINKDQLINFYFEKVDNTGNVQLWPCEDLMSLFCLVHAHLFEGKSLIELGAGFSGLCGIMLAKNLRHYKEIVITDGNTKCVESIGKNLEINSLDKSYIKAEVLLWNKTLKDYNPEYKNKFDFVLISDCLFFKSYHEDLIETIYYLLKEEGECIIISPCRGDTLDLFVKKAEEKFQVYKSKTEVNDIINLTKEENNFQPFLIKMQKKIICINA